MKLEVLVEVRKMWDRIHAMSDEDLKTVWAALIKSPVFDGENAEYAPGVSMNKWTEALYTEMTKRHLTTGSD